MSKRTGEHGYVNDFVPMDYPCGISKEGRALAGRDVLPVSWRSVTPDKFMGRAKCTICGMPAIGKRKIGLSNKLAPVCGSKDCRDAVACGHISRIDASAITTIPDVV